MEDGECVELVQFPKDAVIFVTTLDKEPRMKVMQKQLHAFMHSEKSVHQLEESNKSRSLTTRQLPCSNPWWTIQMSVLLEPCQVL